MNDRRGPRPGMPQRLSPARRRVLQAVVDLGRPTDDQDEPRFVTLTAVAELLGGHPNTSRQQLTALVTEGLAETGSVPTGRPGRRPQGFRATTRGLTALGDGQNDEYRDIVGAFATYLVQREPQNARDEARNVGQIWGEREAESLTRGTDVDEPMDGLIEVLDMLGFSPSRTSTDRGPALVLSTCPLLNLAHENPEVICEMHQGMIDSVLRRFGAREGVDLLPMADPDGCRIEPRGTPA